MINRKYTGKDGEVDNKYKFYASTDFYSISMRELFYFYRAMLSGDSNLMELQKDSTQIARISSFSTSNELSVVTRLNAICV